MGFMLSHHDIASTHLTSEYLSLNYAHKPFFSKIRYSYSGERARIPIYLSKYLRNQVLLALLDTLSREVWVSYLSGFSHACLRALR